MVNVNQTNVVVKAVNKNKVKKILMTTLFLSVVTMIEFFFTFTLEKSNFLIFILVSLTVVKAFYIVGEFMHLKYEVKSLIMCILIPVLFLIWFVVSLVYEGLGILDSIINLYI